MFDLWESYLFVFFLLGTCCRTCDCCAGPRAVQLRVLFERSVRCPPASTAPRWRQGGNVLLEHCSDVSVVLGEASTWFAQHFFETLPYHDSGELSPWDKR